jgi:hypothetical protein
MSLATEIDDALGVALDDAGEMVTIFGHTPTQKYEGIALVTGGGGGFDGVTGGYYVKDTYVISVRKSDCTFTPEPGMLVEARSKQLRIPDNGVTNLRAHYRLEVVGRDAPR